jgi:hypothetical protein
LFSLKKKKREKTVAEIFISVFFHGASPGQQLSFRFAVGAR